MKHKDLIATLASRMNLSEQDIDQLLQAATEAFRTHLVDAQTVSIQGFGVFDVKRKEERLSVHPVTKDRTLIPPKQVVGFKQSNTLKVKVNEIVGHE